MSIWKDHFSLSVLFRWDVFNWIVATFFGVGGIAISLEYFYLASVCFGLAGIVLVCRFTYVAIKHPGKRSERIWFALVTNTLLVAVTAGSIWGTLAYMSSKISTPLFSVEQGSHWILESRAGTDRSIIVTSLTITNKGKAAGSVKSLDLSLTIGGRTYESLPIVPPNRDYRQPMSHDSTRAGTIVLPGYRFWTYAVGDHPIQPDSAVPVWTFGEFSGVPLKQLLENSAVLTVKCADVNGRVVTSDFTFTPGAAIPASQMSNETGILPQ